MVKQKKAKKDSTKLAVYFGALVIFIVLVSGIFKSIDIFRSSKFDSKNSFTLALVNKDRIDLLHLSPKEGKLSRLTLSNTAFLERAEDYQIPYESVLTAEKEISGNPKREIANLVLHKRSIKGNLTIVDLINLWLVSRTVPSEKIEDQSVKFNDSKSVAKLAATFFQDPQILEEDVSVEVTNAAGVPGLGNKVSNYITNVGGKVVLVNTSRDKEKASRIYYKDPSYTVSKLSRILGIKAEKKDLSSISDIMVVVGEDY